MSKTHHLSRLAAPQTWPIKRKGIKWVIKPRAGPHNQKYSMPLVIFMRDILKITNSVKDSKKILVKGLLKVNKKVVRKENFSAGLFDVIEIPSIKKYWRVLFNKKGKLSVLEISDSDAKLFPAKIMSKKTLRKGKIQFSLSNGWTFLSDKNYSISDTLFLDAEKKSVVKNIKLQKGNLVYFISGRHIGHTAQLKEVRETGLLKKEKVAILENSGEIWQSNAKQLFAIGENQPEIKLEQ